MPPEIISKTFWHLFSHVAISLGHSPNEAFGPFYCWSADKEIVRCTLNNYASDWRFIDAKLDFWVWFKKSVATSIVITIFISLFVYCINKVIFLQKEYDVCAENMDFLKIHLDKAVNKFLMDCKNKCDAMFEDSARYHKREFEVYLDTLNFQHQKQPEEKKVPENDESDINAPSEFEF
jgi:hypothetical protein